MTLLLLVSGCAEVSESVEVAPRWYVYEAECADAAAVWEAPPGLVALTIRRPDSGGADFYIGGSVSADGLLSVTCTDDVSILYAVVE
jgi:hypothetical protein